MEYPSDVIPKQLQVDLSRHPKIPRPANAFMLYANANRKKMAQAFPLESNKEISKRLGKEWKELNTEQKSIYYTMAKKVGAEHKKKYPDYVYNPKEARIRKAMRDANRERALGVVPTTRGGHRTQPWVLPEQDDQFMMQSPHGMRGVVSPMCGNGFPIAGNGSNGQFMTPMHSYNKHIHLAPHEQPYLQTNPMAQLQHQTEMWHYHESPSSMRPSADQFMLPATNQMPNYHHQPQPTQVIETHADNNSKLKRTMENYTLSEDSQSRSPQTNENVSPNAEIQKLTSLNEHTFDKDDGDGNSRQQQADNFMEMYQEDVIIQNPFEKEENSKTKKNSPLINTTTTTITTSNTTTTNTTSTKPQKSLPDFNEAFGSTERGRFQSPPDPRLLPKQGYLDFFLINNDLKFDDFNI